MLLGHIIHTLHMESSYVLSREVASYKCSKTLFRIKIEYNQNTNPTKYWGWTQVLRKGKQFLLH
jgi:hypothetical protein